jgi:hypothetical protein
MTKQFITKDSGARQEFSTGMQRDIQEGKPRFDLIFPLNTPLSETLIYRWAMLLERGSRKYASRNWEKAKTQEEYERFKSSAARHFAQLMAGEDDEDHFAAVCFNLQGMIFVQSKLEKETEGVFMGHSKPVPINCGNCGSDNSCGNCSK